MHRTRWIYVALVCVLIALYFAVPPARAAVAASIGLITVAAIIVQAVTRGTPRRTAWLLLALGVVVVTVGQVSFDLSAHGGHVHTYPSGTDWWYLAAYPPLSVGLLWLGFARSPARDLAAVIDTAALALGGSLIGWIVLVRPTADSMTLSEPAKLVMIAGWVGDVVICAAALRLLIVWARNTSGVLVDAARLRCLPPMPLMVSSY